MKLMKNTWRNKSEKNNKRSKTKAGRRGIRVSKEIRSKTRRKAKNT